MTPAVRFLTRHGVNHKIVSYDHDPAAESFGLEAANALNLDPTEVFKTLLVTVTGGSAKPTEYVVAVVPVTHQLDLKALATLATGKRAALAEPATAQRLTGYVVGGISPFGQKKQLRTFVDATALDHPKINVSGGRRGLEIILAPCDLVELLNAEVCSLRV